MKRYLVGLALILFGLCSTDLLAQDIIEGGVKIRPGRVFNGERSGRRFYGYSSVEFVFPHTNGGTLSFTVWNDQQKSRLSTFNFAAFVVNDQKFYLPSYSTPKDLKEFYVENRGEWGPGGGSRARIDIPPNVPSVTVSNEGSETGIELSDVQFSGSRLGRPVEYEEAVNTTSECNLSFSRTFNGARSGTAFYGYSGGEIVFPNRRGGILSFRLWNDQHRTRATTQNTLVVQVGSTKYQFEQYSTPLDLNEYYTENPNEWGPAGGSEVKIQIPPSVTRVSFSNPNADTGFELSGIQFATGANLGRQFVFEEHVNWTSQTYNEFGRVFTGQNSGKKFLGYSGGNISLPHKKGGRLRFTAWNDQQRTRPETRNFVRSAYADLRQATTVRTTNNDLREYYTDTVNDWGPAGGKTVELDIPPGVTRVEIGNEGSDTGIELTDIQFSSQPMPTTISGYCGGGKSPVAVVPPPPAPAPPPPPPAEVQPSEMGTPDVYAVTPSGAPQGSRVNLRLSGKDFAPGVRLAFHNQAISILSVEARRPEELLATVQIAPNADLGSTTLFVTNPNGRQGMAGFEVTRATARAPVAPPPAPAPVAPPPAPVPAPAPAPTGVPTQGLAAWYRFTEGGGSAVRDFSGNENNAVLTNGPEWISGKAGGGISLNGRNHYMSTNLDVQPSAMPETTWTAWVYPAKTTGSGRQHILSSSDGGNDRGVLIEAHSTSFGVTTGTGVWEPAAVSPNEWQFIAVVYTPNGIEFYKNGVRYVRNTAPRGQATKNRLDIGRNPSYGEYYQGMVSDVRIYNRALSAVEIEAIRGSGNR
jgi:hypothetical protein